MTRTIKLAVAAAMALGATSAFATNGDTLIGLGAKARGMGGTGIGMSHGAESGLTNPSLITSVDGTEISFGGTIFMPKVKYDANTGSGYQNSDADFNMIPEVSIANEAIKDTFYWGIGMWGVAGMGVDYREAGTAGDNYGGTMGMVTNLQLMQFGVPLAIKVSGASLGVTPIVQYGSLDINYINPLDGTTAGAGVAQDFGFGFNIGASYDFAEVGVKGLTVGAVYKSEIEMEYKQQLSSATAPFSGFGVPTMGDKLAQPAEIGVGISYSYMGSTLAFDYKQIKWGDAKGYKDFNWDDQNVYSVGYEYTMNNWAVRAGFNYAEQPIEEMTGATPTDAALNMFNLLGFPATVEQHYSIGGTYEFTKVVSVDAAFTYAPETETSYQTAAFSGMLTGDEVCVKHHQYGISIQGNYAF